MEKILFLVYMLLILLFIVSFFWLALGRDKLASSDSKKNKEIKKKTEEHKEFIASNLKPVVKIKYRHKEKKPAFYGLCGLKQDYFEKTYVLNSNNCYENAMGLEVSNGKCAIFDEHLIEWSHQNNIDIQVLDKNGEWVDYVLLGIIHKLNYIKDY